MNSNPLLLLAGAAALCALELSCSPASAANIITFDNNATGCGGSVLCSTNSGPLPTGTQGYVETGTTPFNLSTITQWFQIDTDGVSHLANQPVEPLGGAGSFLVKNDTGSTLTTFSLTLTDTFRSSTSSVTFCSGSSGPLCDNFQAGKGAAAPSGASEALSGPDFFSCTNGSAMGGFPCASTGGQAAANFEPDMVTFTWSGLNIASGATFDITFASWNNSAFAVPAPLIGRGLPVLLAFGGILFGVRLLERRKKRSPGHPAHSIA
jgi:hypothetical protein